MKALIDQYSDIEFSQIIKNSFTMSEVAKKLGYAAHSGSNSNRIKQRIDKLELSTDHFLSYKKLTKRTEENVFIENSTACQKTLREWYLKGKYTPYVCSLCGQEPFWQNKKLTLILDHINGKNHDDRLENLRWVCPNCNQQLDTTNGKNIKKTSRKKHYYCIDCGKEISAKSTRCQECYSKKRVTPPQDMLVSREELKNLIRNKSFVQIGKDFGVTDNAVRKWCDKYNLPRKKSEINKINELEWEKI